jgi:peptidoglycan-N-acetylglucosamine deacetylase
MNILTFDIEEWFHILDNEATSTERHWLQFESRMHKNMDRIHELLEKTNQKATFFCLGWVARKYPEVIKQIVKYGHEVATHSDLHQLAYTQSPEAFEADLVRSIKCLEDVSGTKVRAYRAPGFSIKEENKWVFEILLKSGIEIDCSVFPAQRAHGGFEQFGLAEPCLIQTGGMQLKEFPINLAKVFGRDIIFSGGGYFRLLPFFLLSRFTRRSAYVMTYFHPRDFDPHQPMVPGLSVARKFKSYYGLSHALPKLEKWINQYDFIDIKTADQAINWQQARVVHL